MADFQPDVPNFSGSVSQFPLATYLQLQQQKASDQARLNLEATKMNQQATIQAAQAGSDFASTLIDVSKEKQRKQMIQNLADYAASQANQPQQQAPLFSMGAVNDMGPRLQTASTAPVTSFDPEQGNMIPPVQNPKAEALRQSILLDPTAYNKGIQEDAVNPLGKLQKQAQFMETQSLIAQKQRELATSGPYNDSLKAQGKQLGIQDAEMAGLQNKDLETRINQELKQKQIDQMGVRGQAFAVRNAQEATKALDEKLAPPTSQIGVEFSRVKGFQRILTVAGTNGGRLTPQMTATVGGEVANLALTGGSNQRIAAEMIEKYIPDTIATGLQAKIQWLKNKPQDARAQAVIRPMLLEAARIATESEQNVRNTQLSGIEEAVANGALTPGQARVFKMKHGIDPDTGEIKSGVIPGLNIPKLYQTLQGLGGQDAPPDLLDKSGGDLSKMSTDDLISMLSKGQ